MSEIRNQILSKLSEGNVPDVKHKWAYSGQVKDEVWSKVAGVMSWKTRELSASVLRDYIRWIVNKNDLHKIDPVEAVMFIYKVLLKENVNINRDSVLLLRELFNIWWAQQFSLLDKAKHDHINSMAESNDAQETTCLPAQIEADLKELPIKKIKKEKAKDPEKEKLKEEKERLRISDLERIEKLKIIIAFRKRLISKINSDERAFKKANKEKMPRKLKKGKKEEPRAADPVNYKLTKPAHNPNSIKERNARAYNELVSEIENSIESSRQKIGDIKNPEIRSSYSSQLEMIIKKLFKLKSANKPLKELKEKLRLLNVNISKSK